MLEKIIINALCLVIVLAALGVACWAALSGQLEKQGIDGLFLIFVCLLVASAFAWTPWQAIREGFLDQLLKRLHERPDNQGTPQADSVTAQEAQEGG